MSYKLFQVKRGRIDLNTDKPFLTLLIHRSKSAVRHQLHINHSAYDELGQPEYAVVWYDEERKRIKVRGIHKDDPNARKLTQSTHGRLFTVSTTGLAFVMPPGRYWRLVGDEFEWRGLGNYQSNGRLY